MTQEEILQYNKRCALFLGWTYVEDGDSWIPPKTTFSQFYTFSSNLMYDSDWNWIMEVVEKINQSKITAPMNGIPDSIMPYIETRRPIIKGLININKEETAQAINQFLIWYNENKISTVV